MAVPTTKDVPPFFPKKETGSIIITNFNGNLYFPPTLRYKDRTRAGPGFPSCRLVRCRLLKMDSNTVPDSDPARHAASSEPAGGGPCPGEVCILAGGLSRRMGRDKADLRIGDRNMLEHVQTTVSKIGWPVRVIRRDIVSHCGPLGGVYTGLKTASAEVVLFLSCDMPFISAATLLWLRGEMSTGDRGLFVRTSSGVGFPLILRKSTLNRVERQVINGQWSLQELARWLRAATRELDSDRRHELFNINTMANWEEACARWHSTGSGS